MLGRGTLSSLKNEQPTTVTGAFTDTDGSLKVFHICCFSKLTLLVLILKAQPTLAAATLSVFLPPACGRWPFAPMERLLVVDHFVISIVGGEGVLLCPFPTQILPAAICQTSLAVKKEPRYEISRGDPSEKSLFCCRNGIITYGDSHTKKEKN